MMAYHLRVSRIWFASLLCLLLVTSASASTPRIIARSYPAQALDGGFANPERGFYRQDAPLWLQDARSPQTAEQLRALRVQGIAMARWYFLIDEFRSAPIDAATLRYIGIQFAQARDAGVKVIPRFAYNFPQGDADSYPYQEADAPRDRVLEHIAQLEPILRDNADVIAFMEIGFVGAWGEWHSSTHDLIDEDTGINANARAIIDRLLQALPPDRMVAMRYTPYKQQLYGDDPLTAEQAFSGTPQARMGAHNDCFLASSTDWGTYPDEPAARESLKAYLNLDNRFVPQGGETCNADADAQPYIGCANALNELARLRYSVLNIDYEQNVLDGWRVGGCFAQIADRLGYRFRLTHAAVGETGVPGETWAATLGLINDGFASPYNPRGIEVVLRSEDSGAIYRFPIQAQYDPRRWLPDDGEITIAVQAALPISMAEGRYEVLLHLPDPHPRMYDRPEYAIRLANSGVWEAETGFNRLGIWMDVRAAGSTSGVHAGRDASTRSTLAAAMPV
jgi:hypothetical protein